MDKVEFKLSGFEMKTKVAVKIGTGAHILVPKDWMGKRVSVILIDE